MAYSKEFRKDKPRRVQTPFPADSGSEPYVFVSYAHADAAIVYEDIKSLHQAGLRIWYDQGIQAGAEWNEKIAHAVRNCYLVIVFLSPNAIDSTWVKDELLAAKSNGTPILAVYVSETPVSGALKCNWIVGSVSEGTNLTKRRIGKSCAMPRLAIPKGSTR